MVKNLFLSFKTVVPKFATSLVLKSSQYMWESFVEIFSPFLLIPFFFKLYKQYAIPEIMISLV